MEELKWKNYISSRQKYKKVYSFQQIMLLEVAAVDYDKCTR